MFYQEPSGRWELVLGRFDLKGYSISIPLMGWSYKEDGAYDGSVTADPYNGSLILRIREDSKDRQFIGDLVSTANRILYMGRPLPPHITEVSEHIMKAKKLRIQDPDKFEDFCRELTIGWGIIVNKSKKST